MLHKSALVYTHLIYIGVYSEPNLSTNRMFSAGWTLCTKSVAVASRLHYTSPAVAVSPAPANANSCNDARIAAYEY
jgi:hypothetical protein